MALDRTVDVEIAAIGSRGDGVATTEKGMIYVPYSGPGDLVRVRLPAKKTGHTHAEIVEILRPGPDSQAPVCPHFTECGGCSVQHLAYPAYETWKRQLVCSALQHRGLDPSVVLPMVSGGQARRRRTRLSARKTSGGLLLGYRAPRSHLIVPVLNCAVLSPAIVESFDDIRDILQRILNSGEAAEVAVTLCASGLDLTIASPTYPDLAMREALVAFADAINLARLNWQLLGQGRLGDAETVVRRRAVELPVAGTSIEPPPDAFIQPTAEGERVLQDGVKAALAGASRVADLYAGCGSFALVLADSGSFVRAFDAETDHLEALVTAARRGGFGERVSHEVRDLHRRPLAGEDLLALDGVVLDPPRAGALSQVKELARTPVPIVAYVSCNPASFARDARILVDTGYRLESVLPVDQFLFTAHIELFGVFSLSA
jgi:23S rRNA (uracil1939-C5)-methyltransferase